MSETGIPPGVTHISTCPNCHFEKLDWPGGWKWYCDAEHPEVLAQIAEYAAKQAAERAQADDDFWQRRDD